MRVFSYLWLLGIILFGLVLAVLNPGTVEFNYYFGSKHLPLPLALVLALGAGMLVGMIATLFILLRLKKDNLLLRSRLKAIEKEVDNLRSAFR